MKLLSLFLLNTALVSLSLGGDKVGTKKTCCQQPDDKDEYGLPKRSSKIRTDALDKILNWPPKKERPNEAILKRKKKEKDSEKGGLEKLVNSEYKKVSAPKKDPDKKQKEIDEGSKNETNTNPPETKVV